MIGRQDSMFTNQFQIQICDEIKGLLNDKKEDDAVKKVAYDINVLKWIDNNHCNYTLMHWASYHGCNKFIASILNENNEEVFSIIPFEPKHFLLFDIIEFPNSFIIFIYSLIIR